MTILIDKGTKNNYTSSLIIDKDRGLVQKTIDYFSYSQELFDREVYWLTMLSHTGIVPAILGFDPNTFTITMTWCGEVLSYDNKPENVYEQLYNISIILLKNKCFYNDWKYGNFLVKDGKITVIDFGWCPKINEDFTCSSAVNSLLTEKPCENIFNDILKESHV